MAKQEFINYVKRFQGILNIDDARKARMEERQLERERELQAGDVPLQNTTIENMELNIALVKAKGELLSLNDNWDGDGAKRIDEATFQRIEGLLMELNAIS